MHGSDIVHYIKRCFELGPVKSFDIVVNRFHQYRYNQTVHRRALQGVAGHSWHQVSTKLSLPAFESWWKTQCANSLAAVDEFYTDVATERIIADAQRAVHKTFDLLGSGPVTFKHMPWHVDIRLQQQQHASSSFDPTQFYRDITVQAGITDALAKDIKLPWELSRCVHFYVLARAYSATRDEQYAQAFREQVTDWLDHNPYLMGVNWVCPMDVGLRAINWIIAWQYFKDAPSCTTAFWQRFVEALYNHMVYLEHHWELYDSRTSNHYLSNLVAYQYLCWFFEGGVGVREKMQWCYQELLREFDKQVFEEGTDYESTTSYHRLVTELFYHAYLMFGACKFIIPERFERRLQRMFTFIDQCMINEKEWVQIGDNDSGKVLFYGVTPSMIDTMKDAIGSRYAHYQKFGLSLMKDDQWHVSLRHHAYEPRQPTAHLHNDAGSITVALQGVPFIVDPGSYVYTPSVYWRNHFRSIANHNTFFVEGQEPVPLDDKLFFLDIPEAAVSICQDNMLQTTHYLYKRLGLVAQRRVEIFNERLVIEDWWKSLGTIEHSVSTCWNFTLHPDVKVRHSGQALLIEHGNHVLRLEAEHAMEIIHGWYSPSYGVKVPCMQVRMCAFLATQAVVRTVLCRP